MMTFCIVRFAPAAQQERTELSLVGDAIALASGLCVALFLTLIRWMLITGRAFNSVFASAVGNLLCALGVAVVAAIFGESIVSPPKAILVNIVDGFCVNCVVVAFSIAPRYITSAHIGLISLIETLLGPLWVFVAFGERPPVYTLAGGALVVVVVVAHETRAVLLEEEELKELEKSSRGADAHDLATDDLQSHSQHGSPIDDDEQKAGS